MKEQKIITVNLRIENLNTIMKIVNFLGFFVNKNFIKEKTARKLGKKLVNKLLKVKREV